MILLVLLLLTVFLSALATALPTESQMKYCINVLQCEQCTERTRLTCKTTNLMKHFPYDKFKPNFYEAIEVSNQLFWRRILSEYMFINLKVVREIVFTATNINQIQAYTFRGLSQLKRILLNNNQLGLIERNAFHGLQLSQLYLDDNPNLELQLHAFEGLNVDQLSMSNCNLSSITYVTFQPLLPHLKVLALANNRIHHVSNEFESVFSRIKSLQLLSLGNNPLNCDCANLWLIKVLIFRYRNDEANPLQRRPFHELYPNCYNAPHYSLLTVDTKLLQCHNVRIKSLRLHTDDDTCHSVFTCEASRPGLHFVWRAFLDNGTRYTLRDRQSAVVFNSISNASSTLYLTEQQQQLSDVRINTIECEVSDLIITTGATTSSVTAANITLLKSNCIAGFSASAAAAEAVARERRILFVILVIVAGAGTTVILIQIITLISMSVPRAPPPLPPATPTLMLQPLDYEEPYSHSAPPSPPAPPTPTLHLSSLLLNNDGHYYEEPYALDWRYLSPSSATSTTKATYNTSDASSLTPSVAVVDPSAAVTLRLYDNTATSLVVAS